MSLLHTTGPSSLVVPDLPMIYQLRGSIPCINTYPATNKKKKKMSLLHTLN